MCISHKKNMLADFSFFFVHTTIPTENLYMLQYRVTPMPSLCTEQVRDSPPHQIQAGQQVLPHPPGSLWRQRGRLSLGRPFRALRGCFPKTADLFGMFDDNRGAARDAGGRRLYPPPHHRPSAPLRGGRSQWARSSPPLGFG